MRVVGLDFLDPGGCLTQLRRWDVGPAGELVAAFAAAPYTDGAALDLGARAARAFMRLLHLQHYVRPALL